MNIKNILQNFKKTVEKTTSVTTTAVKGTANNIFDNSNSSNSVKQDKHVTVEELLGYTDEKSEDNEKATIKGYCSLEYDEEDSEVKTNAENAIAKAIFENYKDNFPKEIRLEGSSADKLTNSDIKN